MDWNFSNSIEFRIRKILKCTIIGIILINRTALLEVLTDFLKANNLKVNWEGIESAPNEALVNALAMSLRQPCHSQALGKHG